MNIGYWAFENIRKDDGIYWLMQKYFDGWCHIKDVLKLETNLAKVITKSRFNKKKKSTKRSIFILITMVDHKANYKRNEKNQLQNNEEDKNIT